MLHMAFKELIFEKKHTIESNDHRNISNPVSTQKQNSLFIHAN